MINVIPAPARVDATTSGSFRLEDAVSITVNSDELQHLADLFAADIEAQTGIRFSTGTAARSISLELVTDDPELDALAPIGGVRADDGDPTSERYGINIQPDVIRVWANSAEGIYRGLTSLRQLVGTGNDIPTTRILDGPRLAWRGFSLDTSRSFWNVDQVKQIIDLLALYKFNVLHFHITDSEGWRLEIDSHPNLTTIGGQGASGDRAGGFYTKSEFSELVAYAAARFVTLLPEIDMPGHAAAILKSIPELAGDGTEALAAEFRQRPAMIQFLHPDNPNLVPFLTEVLTEVAALTPGPYLHIGGDEPFGMPDELYDRFITLVRPLVYATGKKIVVWQEAARAGIDPENIAQYWLHFDPTMFEQLDLNALPEDIRLPDGSPLTPEIMSALIGSISKSTGDVDKALACGSKIIVSLSTKSYLDTPYKEESSDPNQSAEHARLGMPFYPKSTIEEFLDWDPATIHESLSEDQIAGVEAAIWCETIVTFDDLLFLILPRLPGIAEKGWTAAGGTTWENYRLRLAAQSPLWRQRNLNYFRSSLVDWI